MLKSSSSLTSDKHISRVGVKARFGVDTQGVKALVLLVEVDEGERGPFTRPVCVNPFRGLQRDSYKSQRENKDILGEGIWGLT